MRNSILLQKILVAALCAFAWSLSQEHVMAEGQKDTYESIRREALRPNGDPEGRALPLASRWTVNNFTDKDTVGPSEKPGVHWPFLPDRLMDDIDAGHHVMPFLSWLVSEKGGGYSVSWPDTESGLKRIAAAGLPFEIVAGNLEDAMFGKIGKINNADRYWHRPMAENPAHIRADIQGKSACVFGMMTDGITRRFGAEAVNGHCP
jgi:hypothetical protein